MSTIWVKEFTGGLNTTRIAETTQGGSLVRALEGHINRGGEFEKRAKFAPEYTLPAGTKGLAHTNLGLYVFGHIAPPTMPTGVSYMRLQHPDGVTALSRVLSFDLYAGKIYVVGEFADGGRYHFYDGVRIAAWYDGRSRASFNVTAGGVNAATAAVGSFEVTGGTLNAGVNEVTDITIDGVSIISATDVDHTGNNATTAAAIAAAITGHTSSPNYTATSDGQTVYVTAAATGTTPNGKAIVVSVAGDVTVGNQVNMAGGAGATTATLSDLKVDGVSIIGSPVVWATSNSNMAALIAAAVNSHTSSPDYTATSDGVTVSIVAGDAGSGPNERAVAFTLANGLAVDNSTTLALAGGTDTIDGTAATGSFTVTGGTSSPGVNKLTNLTINGVAIINAAVDWTTSHTVTAAAIASAINGHTSSPNYTATSDGAVVTVTAAGHSDFGVAVNGQSLTATLGGDFTVGNSQAMAGGIDEQQTFVPGTFVKTIGSRVHSVSGPNEHFSGIQQPTRWTTDVIGAGFIDMSTQAGGAEDLVALAKYQQWVAVFAESAIQIWFFDSDPTQNKQIQVLANTGTASARSVTQFGDNDLFYLSESGLRSLRARDASNSAATSDIGVPVDTLITEKLRALSADERAQVIGLIEPRDGRFWLIMRNQIFVFTFFPSAKVSAWSIYTPFHYVNGTKTTFSVDDAVVWNRRVYLRSGETIFCYGGLATGGAYDATQAEGWMPYLDAGTPSVQKAWTGIDAAVRGSWEIRASYVPTETGLTIDEPLATITETTYSNENVGIQGMSTHVSLRFKSVGEGAALLSSMAVHFVGDEKGAA